MKRSELKVGMYIKTKGARDRSGLRKIVAIEVTPYHGTYLLVDHYKWRPEKRDGLKMRVAERAPYASRVMLNKVVKVYEMSALNEVSNIITVED